MGHPASFFVTLSGAKDVLLASVGNMACTSKQQVLPVGQDDKFSGLRYG
jgi:hypothetical protein